MTGDNTLVSAGLIFVNTNMSAAVACCVTMLYTLSLIHILPPVWPPPEGQSGFLLRLWPAVSI